MNRLAQGINQRVISQLRTQLKTRLEQTRKNSSLTQLDNTTVLHEFNNQKLFRNITYCFMSVTTLGYITSYYNNYKSLQDPNKYIQENANIHEPFDNTFKYMPKR